MVVKVPRASRALLVRLARQVWQVLPAPWALLALACLAPPEGTEREDRLDPRALLGAPGRWESQAPRARRVKREMRVHVACRASRVQ